MRAKRFCRRDRRRADDLGRGPDDAAGGAVEIPRRDREREGRIRQRHSLVYPIENQAMRPYFIVNRCFAYLFSYLVNTRLTDTLCGTKVLLRKDYEVLARERGYFGNFDPFGDFDLIFGAAKQNLKIIETPIHYKARTFGETQISRFRDGWLLLQMVWFAYRKLKAV